MEQRYATSPEQIPGMDTAELRRRYLVDDLFVADDVRAAYTHHDRVVLAGIQPVTDAMALPAFPAIGRGQLFECREAGLVTVRGAGTITVHGTDHKVGKGACLYVGRGAQDVAFASADGAEPARFYLFSAPAHTAYPTTLVEAGGG